MKVVRNVLWIFISSLLIVTGVICILNPDLVVTSIAIFLGIALLLAGIEQILIYSEVREEMTGSGWMLVEGIGTILLAFFCFFHHYLTTLTIPLIFSIWLLFAGISRIVSALDLKHWKIKEWWLFFLLGLFLVGFGIASLLDPVLANFTLSVIVGMILLIEGMDSFIKGYYLKKAIRMVRQFLKG